VDPLDVEIGLEIEFQGLHKCCGPTSHKITGPQVVPRKKKRKNMKLRACKVLWLNELQFLQSYEWEAPECSECFS
jgi:hypothetical protein